MKPQLFVDLDGVLADFDAYFEECFGVRPSQDTYEPAGMWDAVRAHPTFYRNLPLMEGAIQLWMELCKLHSHPIILTGIPYNIRGVKEQKKDWVREHLGSAIPVICCRSVDKCLYSQKGDILLDDRLKYSKFWTDAGGVFVHHRNNVESVKALRRLYGY